MEDLARTLPASWFCSMPLYQLERRAVFLKCWYLLGPISRFHKTGVEGRITYEIAQVKLFVENTSNHQNKISKMDITIYAEDKKFEVRSHVTERGLVFTTLSSETPPFEEFFKGLDSLINKVDFTELPHRRSIRYSGRFNWKTMIDGYQECLHCQYTHPTFSKYYPPTFYSVANYANFSQHIADPMKPNDGLFLYFFPISTLNVYGGGMSCFRACPTSDPGTSIMEFDYYHAGSDAEFEEYFDFVRQVALEDFELCEKAQSNLERGVYGEGILNPKKENGVAFYQQRVREMVYHQLAAEEEEEEDVSGDAVVGEAITGDDGIEAPDRSHIVQAELISVV